MIHLSDFVIKVMADYLVIPILVIAAWMFLRLPRAVRLKQIGTGLAAGLLSLLLALGANFLYAGERPFMALGVAPKAAFLHNGGFPSLHALIVFAAVFVVWAATKNVKVTLLLLGMSLLVAAGRIIALVHSPFDILGGVVCAFIAVSVLYGREFLTLRTRDAK